MIGTLPESIRALPPKDRVKLFLLLALLAAHTVFSIFFTATGHFLVDEVTYHFMVRDLVENGSLLLWNGYEEFPSRALLIGFMRVRPDGTLASQYPHISTFIAAPFYWAMGFRGLFALNAIAFTGVVGLCFVTARRLFRDNALALNACLILSLATFAWQYSQAAWPHILSSFFVSLAIYFAVVAVQATGRRHGLRMAFLAGLVVGIGAGVRLDVVFVLPAIMLPFLFAVPSRPLPILAVGLGLLPGLLALAVIDQIKFGIFSPFTYGYSNAAHSTGGVAGYLPLAAAGLICVAGAWFATRPAGRLFLARYRWPAIVAALFAALILLAVPQVRAIVARLADGALQLLVDLRFRDSGLPESGVTRSPDGAVLYFGTLIKKSLLQSAPYLTALFLPATAFLRGRNLRALAILFLVPGAYIGVYSYFAWHGGQTLNMRYFVPTLPYLAILTAYAWREIANDTGRVWIGLALLGGAGTIILHIWAAHIPPSVMVTQETIYLTAPLALAALIGVFLVMATVLPGDLASPLRGAGGAALIIGLVWGGSISFGYDFRHVYSVRQGREALARDLRPLVRPDSILFTPPTYSFEGLIDTPRVRFAMPVADNYESFRPLINYHLRAGHGVYIWVSGLNIGILQGRGLLAGFRTRPLYRGYGGMLLQILSRSGPESGG